MTGSHTPEEQLVEHLDYVRRVARLTARRVGLMPSECEECESWVQLRLVEDDYSLLRKFRGDSSFKTFITVVVAMLVRDYRAQLHGRWRPSAKARRLGDIAILLERLIHRDGLSFDEAVHTIQSARDVAPDERALREIYRALGARQPLRPAIVTLDPTADAPAGDRADAEIVQAERDSRHAQLTSALRIELERLLPEDRLALHMDVVDGATVASIARALGLLQRPLYDRLKSLRKTLRLRLEAAGVSRKDVQNLVYDGDT